MELELNAKAQKIGEPVERVKEISFTEDVLNSLNSVDLGIHEQKTNDKVSTTWKRWVKMLTRLI